MGTCLTRASNAFCIDNGEYDSMEETEKESPQKDAKVTLPLPVDVEADEADRQEEKSEDNHLSQGSKCLYTQLNSKMHCEGK